MNIREIEKEISVLEQSETNYSNCQKLAILYEVRNGLVRDEKPSKAYSLEGSEFLSVSHSKDPYEVLKVLDEHMECIKALYPAEYNVILKRIKNL
jgi:hypothetical protein